jgi:hypothetical protein
MRGWLYVSQRNAGQFFSEMAFGETLGYNVKVVKNPILKLLMTDK